MHAAPGFWRELRCRAGIRLLQMHYDSRIGHIRGNLSCLDLMLALHHNVLKASDQFVLSKGHSAGVLYHTVDARETRG
jgi:transketolase